jgi:hypothetical protein
MGGIRISSSGVSAGKFSYKLTIKPFKNIVTVSLYTET